VDKETDRADAAAEVLEDLDVSDEVADAVAGGKKKKPQAQAYDPNMPVSSKLSY